MINLFGCLNFNCISTKGNLIFIFISNIIGIAVNSFKIYREKKKEIQKAIPILSTIGTVIDSISLISSVVVFFKKKFMNQKSINKTITISGKILKIIIIPFSIINIIVLVKSFINFENNSFLNSSIKFGDNSTNYTNIDRMNDLKGVKDISLELYKDNNEEFFIIKDDSKFSFINTSEEFIDYESYNEGILNGEDFLFSLIYILNELYSILTGLNWGAVEKKTKILIDTKIESRYENIGENENFIIKFLTIVRGKKFRIFTVVLFFCDIAYLIITSLNFEWLNNNIYISCCAIDSFIMFYYAICLLLDFCTNCEKKIMKIIVVKLMEFAIKI